MPPRKAAVAATTSTVFVVMHRSGLDSVHASIESANEAAAICKEKEKDTVKIEALQLVGGAITLSATPTPKPVKAAPKPKPEPEPEEDELDEPDEPAKPVKKTKPVAEQRAANAGKSKGKGVDANLPDNITKLLKGKGTQLAGKQIVVTGVPPTIGRKNTERIVEAYGGKVMKSLSKKTDLVVVGNDAGPAKLEKIDELGIETVDEDGLIELIEGGGSAVKRSASDEDDDDDMDVDEEESEEEKPAPKGKKQKR